MLKNSCSLIIAGNNGRGKSCTAAILARRTIFNYERNRRAQMALLGEYKKRGIVAPIPEHFVFHSQRNVVFRETGYLPREAHYMDPFKFRVKELAPKDVECQFLPEWSTFIIEEAQKYYSSRGDVAIGAEQFACFEMKRHPKYQLILTTTRFELIDVRIRKLSIGYYVNNISTVYDRWGNVTINVYGDVIPDGNIDLYMTAKPEERYLYSKPKIITETYNVFKMYDSTAEKHIAYDGFSASELIIA